MRQLKITNQITRREEHSIYLYFQEVNKYPMITVEEEVELSSRIRNGDELALQKLVESNLRFVISVAKQFQNQGLSFADLINEGNLGLVKAAAKFDETRGFKFISYAVWWIRQSIMQAIAEQTRTVRLPFNRLALINKISRAVPYLEQQFQREPTDWELAEYLEVSEDSIISNNSLKSKQMSFDKPISVQSDNDFSMYDLVECENVPAPDKLLSQESLQIDMRRALKKLSDKEAEIIILSFGLNGNKVHSLFEIASLLDMSSERVRQIRCHALLILKKLLSGKVAYIENL